MEMLQISVFVSLAKTLHMPATAQELNTTQPHVSKLLSSLEAELGVRLFDRVGRGLVLNDHGRLFYEYAAGALQLMQDGQTIVKGMRGSLMGTVKIGAYAFTAVLHPAIREFSRKNPQVNFYFSEVQQQDASVLLNLTDIVLTAASEQEDSYAMQNYFPVSREVTQEEFLVVISPKLASYPADKETISLKEISDFPMIEVVASPYYQNWVFREPDLARMRDLFGVTVRVGYMANDFFSKVSLLDQGVGFALFPEVCLPSVRRIAPDVRAFRIEECPMRRRILIARKERDQMTSSARAFWDFFLEYQNLEPDR